MKAFLPTFALLALFSVAADATAVASSPLEMDGHAPRLSSEAIPASDRTPQGLAKSDWVSIREAHAAWQHRVSPVEGRNGEWQAHNPGQQWTTRFDGRGFTTSPHGASWQWGLALQSYGFGHSHTEVGGVPEVKTDGGRLTYQWDQQMEEWFVNDQRGLEHGFVLRERPAGGGRGQPLEVVLTVRGGLRTILSADRQTLHFRDDARAAVLNYGGLKVWDVDGKVLPSHFEAAGQKQVRLVVDEADARYPLTIDPIAQQAYLKAGNTGASDWFGQSVAVSGNTVVVGAYAEDSNSTGVNGNSANNSTYNGGAAYVFTRNGSTWTQQAYLKASNTGGGDQFGISVAVWGDTVVIGANCESSNATGVNGNQTNNFASLAGAAYVFTRSGTEWTQQAYLKAGNTGDGDQFGIAVAVSGDTVVVGAGSEDSNATGVNGNPVDNSAANSGAAYLFTRSGTTWTQQAYLKSANSEAGDRFGGSVAVWGDTVVVGAARESSNATGIDGNHADNSASAAGAAYVFTRSGTEWTQQAYLKASNTGAGDSFGTAVAVSGDTVIVGASTEGSNATGVNGNQANNSTYAAGAAYVFIRSGTAWTQQAYLKASNTRTQSLFGSSAAVSGDTVIVGAYGENSNATGINGNQSDNSANAAGAAYVFTRTGTIWSQQAYLKASNAYGIDYFGASVAVSGDTVVIGAEGEDSNATGVNGNSIDDSAGDSGAAYIFTGIGPVVLTPREQWRQLHFGTPLNTGEAADNFDFDQDGLVNLLEWAAGTLPKQPNPYQPTVVRNGAELQFTYSRSLAAFNAGTGYDVEWSGSLAASSWQTTGVTQTVLSTEGDVQTVLATVPAGTERRFLRLRVTAP